jgi:hypothetical protein
MYWPNEPAHLYPDFTQAGGRAAFEAMAADGTIAALQIYSYRVERATFPTAAGFERSAVEAARAWVPDILFVQHLHGTDLTEALWRTLRQELPQTTLIYHDDDPFDRVARRVDRPTAAIAAAADLVLLSGLGRLARLFERHGARTIEYMPSCFAESRFARLDPARAEKTHDIVMIGNRGVRRRLKFVYVPGGRRREQLATRLSETFGQRFALYGGGWTQLASACGSVPFFEQERVIQSGRISANWDHFDTIEYYFSDRLPISLAAGVPHVTTRHVGYDRMFAGCPGLYPCDTVGDAIEMCRWLLSRPDEELLEEGLAARNWAFAHVEADIVFRRAFARATAAHRRRMEA